MSTGWVRLVPGTFLLLTAVPVIVQIRKYWLLSRRGAFADGSCIDQITSGDLHISTIEFFHEGRRYTFDETTVATSRKIRSDGTYRVRYDPKSPGRAEVASKRPGLYLLGALVMTIPIMVILWLVTAG